MKMSLRSLLLLGLIFGTSRSMETTFHLGQTFASIDTSRWVDAGTLVQQIKPEMIELVDKLKGLETLLEVATKLNIPLILKHDRQVEIVKCVNWQTPFFIFYNGRRTMGGLSPVAALNNHIFIGVGFASPVSLNKLRRDCGWSGTI